MTHYALGVRLKDMKLSHYKVKPNPDGRWSIYNIHTEKNYTRRSYSTAEATIKVLINLKIMSIIIHLTPKA